jgi:type III secretion system chaperone SycN
MAGAARLKGIHMPHRQIITEFARRLGMADWRCDDLPAVFQLEGLGALTLELDERGDALLMSLALPLPPYDETQLLAALRRCHPGGNRPFSLACGLRQDRLMLMNRQPGVQLSAAGLENRAMFLIRQATEIRKGGQGHE